VDTIHDEGWVKLHRKSIRSQVFQNDGLWKVWTWCLMKANHEDNWVPIKTGKGMSEVFVERGQFIFGRNTAAKELRMRPRTVHKRMVKLGNMQNCTLKSDTHYTVVTILNYELYQGSGKTKGTTQGTGKGQARDTNKNYKNLKNKDMSGKNTPDPRVKEFFNYWGETFKKETGEGYTFSFKKEGQLARNLLRVHSLESIQEKARAFFRDEQCKRRGLTIGIFFQEVNRLVSLKAMDPLEQAKRELARG
jgi:hypothetical protein